MPSLAGCVPRRLLTTQSAVFTSASNCRRPSADLMSSVTLFLPRFQAWKYSLSAVPELVRADMPRRIAVGRLDLDHLGAQLGQEHGAVGTGAELLQRQDAHALERLGVHRMAFRLTHWRAMMMRCISLVPSPMQVSGASR